MKNESSVNRIIQIKDINIGSNIRILREEHGIKQTDIVKKLQLLGIDISVFSYNRIEKGTQNPTTSFLFAMCELLQCDMNKLFSFPKDITK